MVYAETATFAEQGDSLVELLVAGSENHRNAVNGSFQCIMYASPEASADVCDLSVTVNRGQQADTVDNQYLVFT